MKNVIEIQNMQKKYKEFTAVDSISFSVEKGEIFGLLGPNGAGKTTIIECMIGLKKRSSGSVRILDMDPEKERRKIHYKIGVQLQETAYQDRIKVFEVCRLFSSFYKSPVPFEELLDKAGLLEKRNEEVAKLSGGQRQRLSIVLALIGNPEIVFLDELTTGLDPQARRAIWESILKLKKEGKTIFLTTHYMDEAEYLCDRVCFLNRGKIVALNTVKGIIDESGINNVIILDKCFAQIDGLSSLGSVSKVELRNDKVVVAGISGKLLPEVVRYLEETMQEYGELIFKKPNLEDVFLQMAGSRIG